MKAWTMQHNNNHSHDVEKWVKSYAMKMNKHNIVECEYVQLYASHASMDVQRNKRVASIESIRNPHYYATSSNGNHSHLLHDMIE